MPYKTKQKRPAGNGFWERDWRGSFPQVPPVDGVAAHLRARKEHLSGDFRKSLEGADC